MAAKSTTGAEIRRVYEPAESYGYRALADRLRPRGVRRDDARLDEWAKEVAPSHALRRWYGHEPYTGSGVAHRYRAKLATASARESVSRIAQLTRQSSVVLLTATKGRSRVRAGQARLTRDRILRAARATCSCHGGLPGQSGTRGWIPPLAAVSYGLLAGRRDILKYHAAQPTRPRPRPRYSAGSDK